MEITGPNRMILRGHSYSELAGFTECTTKAVAGWRF